MKALHGSGKEPHEGKEHVKAEEKDKQQQAVLNKLTEGGKEREQNYEVAPTFNPNKPKPDETNYGNG